MGKKKITATSTEKDRVKIGDLLGLNFQRVEKKLSPSTAIEVEQGERVEIHLSKQGRGNHLVSRLVFAKKKKFKRASKRIKSAICLWWKHLQ